MKESSQVMSSFGPRSKRRRLVLSVGGVLAAAVIAAPTASAQFTLAPCQGALAPGQGATFQNSSFAGFKGVFGQEAPVGCGAAAANITWTGTGSGAGRVALGANEPNTNPRNQRDQGYRWAGADEPPNDTQRGQMERGPLDANGQDVAAADNAKLHVVPVAIGAITVIVHLPNACNDLGADLYNERPKVTLEHLEDAFWGDNSPVWGDLMPGLLPVVGCADQKITRAVRRDSSGSTFAFKQLMARINPAHASTWKTLGNQTWPNAAANKPETPATDGGGALATLVSLPASAGYLGYVDLATARKQAALTGETKPTFLYDSTVAPIDKQFWLPLPQALGASPTYTDPQLAPTGYKGSDSAASVKGANCNVPPRNVPATPVDDATYGDWTSTDSTLTGTGYAACTMTYELVWDDNSVVYCNSAEEEAKARTIKDYLSRGVLSTTGQDSLLINDYDRLPANVLAISKRAVDSIDWNKGGQGRPCSTDTPPPVETPQPTPGPGTGTTPPPPPPSNVITVPSSRISGTSIRLSLQLPGAGKISIASSTKPKKGKAIKLTTKSLTVTKAGTQAITVSLSSKAKKALKKDKKLKITLKITYTPNGGVAKTITKTVTVKQPKPKKKSK